MIKQRVIEIIEKVGNNIIPRKIHSDYIIARIIAAISDEPEWFQPNKGEWPEKNKQIIILFEVENERYLEFAFWDGKEWFDWRTYILLDERKIIAWQPLPELPGQDLHKLFLKQIDNGEER